MRLFLPWKGLHIEFKLPLEELDDDLFQELDNANTNIMDADENEAVIHPDYDVASILNHKKLRRIREVWYWTNVDTVPFPEEPSGQLIGVCMGTSLVFWDYDQALADLAKVHEPVRQLLDLVQSGPQSARALARSALDGERSTLPILADALEEAGHPLAANVRKMAKAEPKKVDTQSAAGRGTPLPAKPAPAKPARKASKKGSKSAVTPLEGPTTVSAGTSQEVVLIGGYPAAGKTYLAQTLVGQHYARLNRDEMGGKVDDLLAQLSPLLAQGKSVVLDNLYATRESRAGAVRLAQQHGVPIRFVQLDSGLEDAQFNACLRMVDKCGRVLHPDDHKKAPYKGDASLYPVAVLYKYRKEFQEPTLAEGFAAVERVQFVRNYPADWVNKAFIFDFDGTLRHHEGVQKYPVSPSEVRAFVGRAPKLRDLAAQGYMLLGASNQSGVAKGTVSVADVEACFAETLRQLGVPFQQVAYCPHKVPPISCYCRKPGPGMGVELITRYKLDPRQCVYVGDMGTDKSFAQRCGFRFIDQAEFFTA